MPPIRVEIVLPIAQREVKRVTVNLAVDPSGRRSIWPPIHLADPIHHTCVTGMIEGELLRCWRPSRGRMSVILEFTVEKEQFTLGRILAGPPPMHIELERIVPTGDTIMPFLWVTGEEFEAFEQKVADDEHVDDLVALDKVEDSILYRVTWYGSHNDLIRGITEADGTILEAHADERWYFRLRLPDHDKLSQFHNFCTDYGIALHIVRTYTTTERTESVKRFGLSQEQREALVLGLRRGYFDTPSEVGLNELADELGISQQATSNRIRRGTKQVLREALLSAATDFE